MSAEIQSLRNRVDPNNTLPDVQLVLGPESRGQYGVEWERYFEIQSGGKTVGTGNLAELIPEDRDPFTCFTSIQVEPAYQGKGIGLASYVRAIELCHSRGEVFGSDESVSSSAKRVWERLAKLGVAEVVEEFESAADQGEGFKDFYHGHYEAIDPDFL